MKKFSTLSLLAFVFIFGLFFYHTKVSYAAADISQTGLRSSLVSTDASLIGQNGTIGQFTFVVDVTAVGSDKWVELSGTRGTTESNTGFNFQISNDAGIATSTGTTTFSVSADKESDTNNRVKIDRNETVRFTTTIYFDAATSALYKANLYSVNFATSNEDATNQFLLVPQSHYQTSSIFVNADTLTCVVLTYNMQYRSTDATTGGDVSRLQAYLQSQGYLDSNPTGFYGVLTDQAVKNYQTANGIIESNGTKSSYVGPITRAFIAAHSCSSDGSQTNTANSKSSGDINETLSDQHNSKQGTSNNVTTEQFATASDGTPLNWDVYKPVGNGPWPAVLVIHGGGFKLDSEGPQLRQAAEDLQADGYIAFVIQYRLAPGHDQLPGQKSAGQYPDQTNDVKLAVLAARNDSRTNGKVGAVGGSAGGSHTAFVAADGVAGKDKIDVGVSLSGAYDFSDPSSLAYNDFYLDVTNYINSSDSATLHSASPINFVSSTISPLYLVESQSDPMPTNQFTLMTTELNALGVKNFQTGIVAGGGHSFANWQVALPSGILVRDSAIAFLDSVLKTSSNKSSFHIDSVTPTSAFNDGKSNIVLKGTGFTANSIVVVVGVADDGTAVDQSIPHTYLSSDGTEMDFTSPTYIKAGTYQIYVTENGSPNQSNRVTFQLKHSTSEPTATFTVNGTSSVSVNAGTPVTLKWSSTNADTYYATYTAIPNTCGVDPKWFIASQSGSKTVTLSSDYAGCSYGIGYSITGPGGSADAFINITIKSNNSFPPPTATLTVNGSDSATGHAGDSWTYAWSSTNGALYSSSYTSKDNNTGASCGSGTWVANSSKGSSGVVLPGSIVKQANCTYTMTYTVVGATGNANDVITLNYLGNITYPLTVTKPTLGTVAATGINCGVNGSDCTENYNSGSSITLTATSQTGNYFSGWSGACTGTTNTCTVSMSASKTVTATFKAYTFPILTVKTVGTGRVISTPAGIDCGYVSTNICSKTYTIGSTPIAVTLSISNIQGGYYFSGWSGDCTGTGTCTVTMDKVNKSVTATFKSYTGFNYDASKINTANVLNAINDVLAKQGELEASTISSVLDFLVNNLNKVVAR